MSALKMRGRIYVYMSIKKPTAVTQGNAGSLTDTLLGRRGQTQKHACGVTPFKGQADPAVVTSGGRLLFRNLLL